MNIRQDMLKTKLMIERKYQTLQPVMATNGSLLKDVETFDPPTIDRELGWPEYIGMNTIGVYLHDLV